MHPVEIGTRHLLYTFLLLIMREGIFAGGLKFLGKGEGGAKKIDVEINSSRASA